MFGYSQIQNIKIIFRRPNFFKKILIIRITSTLPLHKTPPTFSQVAILGRCKKVRKMWIFSQTKQKKNHEAFVYFLLFVLGSLTHVEACCECGRQCVSQGEGYCAEDEHQWYKDASNTPTCVYAHLTNPDAPCNANRYRCAGPGGLTAGTIEQQKSLAQTDGECPHPSDKIYGYGNTAVFIGGLFSFESGVDACVDNSESAYSGVLFTELNDCTYVDDIGLYVNFFFAFFFGFNFSERSFF
jgi:hypothetical protein